MIIYNSEIYHYGIPRRSGRYKWGSGKDPYHHGADGVGKNPINSKDDINRKVETSLAAVNREGQKLINKSPGLRKDFGSYKNVDDEEYFEYVARTKHGLNTDTYFNKVQDKNKYVKAAEEHAKVDVSKAKNSATKRVAEDYHKLDDRGFKGKYHVSKKRFAKRYNKTDGDTYSLGLKREARALRFLNAMQGKSIARSTIDVHAHRKIHDIEQKQLDKGRETTAKIINSAMNRYDRKAYSDTFFMSEKDRRKYGF